MWKIDNWFKEDMLDIHLNLHEKIYSRKWEISQKRYEKLMRLLADKTQWIIKGDF